MIKLTDQIKLICEDKFWSYFKNAFILCEDYDILNETESGGKKFYDQLSNPSFKYDEYFTAQVPLAFLDKKRFKTSMEINIPINTETLDRYISEYVAADVELKRKYDLFANWYNDFNKLMFGSLGENDACLFLAAAAFCSANTALDVNILEAAKLFVAVKTDFNRGNSGREILRLIATNVKGLDDVKNLNRLEKLSGVRSSYGELLAPKVEPRPVAKGKHKGEIENFREITISAAKLGNWNNFVLYYIKNNGKLSKAKLMGDLKSGEFAIGGTKIYSFFINLIDPDYEWVVDPKLAIQPATIDRWMIRLFFDKPINEIVNELVELQIIDPKKKDVVAGEIIVTLFAQDIVRQNIVKVMNEYARKHGLKAHQLQALGWVRIRKDYNEPSSKFTSFQDVMDFTDEVTKKIREIDPKLKFINDMGQGLKGRMNKALATIHTLAQAPRFKFSSPEEIEYTIKNRENYEKIYKLRINKDDKKKSEQEKLILSKVRLALKPDNKTIDLFTDKNKDPIKSFTAETRKDVIRAAVNWAKINL